MQERQAALAQAPRQARAADRAFSRRSAPSCRRTAFSSTRSPRSALPPASLSRSTSRAPSCRPAIRTISAGALPPRSARSMPGPTCRWSRSPATAASCSPRTSLRPRCATAFRWSTVVFNDGAFGNVRRIQQERFGNRLIASDLANPDFVRFRRKLRRRGRARHDPQDLRAALRRAFAHRDGPTLIEVPVGAMPSPWEFIHMPKNSRPIAAFSSLRACQRGPCHARCT